MPKKPAPKFTPGPWEVEDGGENYFPAVFIGPHLSYHDHSGNGFRSRLVINEGPTPRDVKKGTGFGTTQGTCIANARLISAAPDMYAALNYVTAMMDYALDKFDWGASALDAKAIQMLNDAPIIVYNAPAKAEGKIK